MTGSVQALLAASSDQGNLTGTPGSVTNTSNATGVRSGNLTLIPDGTFTATGSTAKNWFSPTTAGIGTAWSAKATVNSQTNTNITGPTLGTWVALSSSAQWAFANTGNVVEGFGTMTIAFSRDGGATTAGSMSVTWDVGYTP